MADGDRALFVATLEAAVVDAYRLALEQQSVPAELADTVLVLAQHHDEHCVALAAIALTARSDVESNAALYAELTQQPLDGPAIVAVEEALAATHLETLGVLTTTDAAAAVAGILPVECRHVVVVDPARLPPVQTVDAAYTEARYAP